MGRYFNILLLIFTLIFAIFVFSWVMGYSFTNGTTDSIQTEIGKPKFDFTNFGIGYIGKDIRQVDYENFDSTIVSGNYVYNIFDIKFEAHENRIYTLSYTIDIETDYIVDLLNEFDSDSIYMAAYKLEKGVSIIFTDSIFLNDLMKQRKHRVEQEKIRRSNELRKLIYD